MTKITLTDLVNLENETTAVNAINTNSNIIELAFDNTLSRDGTSPNTMGANLDMNSHRILNLPLPLNDDEPLRLIDAATLKAGGTIPTSPLPVGGTTGQALVKTSNADLAVGWGTIQQPPTGGATSQVLKKNSGTNFDYSWLDPYPTGGSTGQVLTKNSGTNFDVVWQNAQTSSTGLPQGRLTLTNSVPVMATSVTAATTVYYAPYQGSVCPIITANVTQMYPIISSVNDAVGLIMVLGANWLANSIYDCFVALDSGTVRLGTGPDWSAGAVAGSNTIGASIRGTGAGSTELQICNGLMTNKNSMTVRYANASTFTASANTATYVGTIRTGSAGQVSFTYGSFAAGGGTGNLYVWNAYNQVPLRTTMGDSTASWNYTTATTRASNNSSSNRINFLTGLAQGGIIAEFSQLVQATNVIGAFARVGFALNSTTIFEGVSQVTGVSVSSNNAAALAASRAYLPQIGTNFISLNETGDGTNASTFFGAPSAGQIHNLTIGLEM